MKDFLDIYIILKDKFSWNSRLYSLFEIQSESCKRSKLGILQHSVTFHLRHSCQIWCPNLMQSSDIRQNSDKSISYFRSIPCHNCRTSNDIDMKLGPVTKLDNKNMTTSKKKKKKKWTMISCQQIMSSFFLWYMADLGQSGCMVCNSYIFINVNFFSYKSWKQNLNISNTTLILLLWVKILFLPKNPDFLQEIANISKIKGVLALKSSFSATSYVFVPGY